MRLVQEFDVVIQQLLIEMKLDVEMQGIMLIFTLPHSWINSLKL